MSTGWSRRALAPLAAGLIGGAALPATARGVTGDPIADATDGLVLGPGVHDVPANIVVKTDVMLLPGAKIRVAAGRKLSILGDFAAPVAHVFVGPGIVDLNASRATSARPEWWGAMTGSPDADCLAALDACLAAHPVMELRAAEYFISDTWRITRPWCRISGAGFRGAAAGQGTRIVVTSGSVDVMRVGPGSRPQQVNDFLQNVELRGFELARTRPVDSDQGAPAGLRLQYLLYCNIENVSASEHAFGFHAKGLVRSTLRNCVAFRSLPGKRGGTPYRGFLLDGNEDVGLAGGNGSIFLIDCNASIGGEPGVADPVGLLLFAAFADSYVVNLEVAGIATGVRVDGRAARLGTRAKQGHANLHLRMPIIDQCARIGIELLDTSPEALIEISEPYVATGPSAEAGIACERVGGATTILGGQLLGRYNADHAGTAIGFGARDSTGLQVIGLKIADHRQPLRFERCRNSTVQGGIVNPNISATSPAALLRDCSGIRLALQVMGKPDAFAQGCAIDGRAQRIEINCTGIDPAALGERAAMRVLVDGRPFAASATADIVVSGI